MKKFYAILIIALFGLLPVMVMGQASGHGTAAAYITTSSEPWGQTSNISALNAVYGSSGWNKYIYGTDANGNVSNIFSSTRSLVFIEGGNSNTTAMKTFLDANWSTINTWISGGRTLIVSAATNESIGKFQIGTSGVYSERILTNNMVAYSSASTYPNTASNVHPLLRTNVTINGVTGDAYYSGNYYGNYVAHNVITGSGLNSIFTVSGQTSQYTLAEKVIGSGRMLVGGLTLPWFITVASWQPQPQMTRFMYAMLGWVQAVSNPAPTISTTDYSNLGVNSVSTGGSALTANGETITAKGVAYATTQNPTTSNSTASGGTGTDAFSVNLTGLAANTTYYARAYATSPTGTGYGSQISFTTLPANPTSPSSSAGNTICSGAYTNLSVSTAQGTVYWFTDAGRTNFVGTGNPRSVNPSITTTYYAFNYNGSYSTGYTSIAITVNQPASQPATASVAVPANADGLTSVNLSWGQSTGDGTITYSWAVGPTSTVSYETGYTTRGTITNPTITAIATGLTKSTGYYLAVKASNSCGTSVYKRSDIFRTNNERIYVAGNNGKVGTTSSGTDASITQYSAYLADGTAIYAVPDAGYNFVNWSDGSTANPRTDLDVMTSATLTANFAPNRLAFVSQPNETRAGASIASFQVRYTDTYGNTMTSYNEPITIAIQNNPSVSNAGVLSGTTTVTPVNGVATFSGLSIDKTGLDYTLKVSAASPVTTMPISSDFDIIPGAVVNYFTVAGIADPHEAGETTSPKVTAYDAFDNIKYDYSGTVHFTTNNASVNVNKPTVLPADYTFTASDKGIKTFTNGVSLKQYGGVYWVKVNDVTVTSAVGQQSDISVRSAELNFYTIKANSNYPTHNVDNNILAGTAFTVTAYLYDEFGNLKEDFTGNLDVTFTSNASPSPLGNTIVIPSAGVRTFTAGVATISGFTLYNAQETPTITIRETLTGSAGTTPSLTVWPEVLHNFKVQQPNQSHAIGGVRETAGIPFTVMVTARDRYNNIKRDYTGRINFKSSNDNLVQFPTGLQQFVSANAGVKTFTSAITINKADAYWLRVGDSPDAFKTGELQNIVIGPGVQVDNTSELLFTNYTNATTYPASVVAGDFIPVTIRPRDIGSNLLCDCQSVVVKLNGTDQHRNGTAVNGIPALVTIPVTDNHDGSYTALVRVTDMLQTNQITASINGTTVSTTLQVGITVPDKPSLIVSTITRATASITTDENTLVTLQLKDQFGNNRTTNDGTITFSSTEGGFGANNGTAIGYVAAYAGNGTYTATLYASYNASTHGVGVATITTAADFTDATHTDGSFTVQPTVNITEGLPNLVRSTITASDHQISTDETSIISVQLKDHLGNQIQNDRGAITLYTTLGTLGSNAGNASITATYTASGVYTATLYGTQNLPVNGVGTADLTAQFAGSSVSGYLNNGASTPANTVEQVVIGEGIPDVTKIDISVANASITADGSTTVTVQLKDQFGNLIVNNRGTISLSVTPIGVIDNGTNTGGSYITAIYQTNGAYMASFKLNAFGVGTATITGTFSGTAISDNATVTVTPGAATKLAMYTQPAHTTTQAIAGVVFSTQPKVSVQDQWGNITTDDDVSIITAERGSVGTDVLMGTLTATVTDGIATFSDLNYRKSENVNMLFTTGTLTAVTSNTLVIVHHVPSYMALGGTSTQTSGESQIVTLKVYDAYGNIADRFDGARSILFNGAGTSPAPPYNPTVANTAFGTGTNLIFTDGVASADMKLYKEETAYVVAAHADASYSDTYTGATALSIAAANPNGLSVVVSQAQAAYLAITGSVTQVAGTSQTITVMAYDAYNNVATYYNGTKKIRFGGANISNAPSTKPTAGNTDFGTDTELTFANGVASSSISLYKSENAIITATDWTSGSAGITTPADNTVGQTTYVYKLPVEVTSAAASYFAVTGTATQTAGIGQGVTVTAYDLWNNVATGYTGTKNITFSGASHSPNTPKTQYTPYVALTAFGVPTVLTFTAGVASGPMVLVNVETANVKASDGTINTSDTYDLEVAVNHATENYFAVTGSSTQVAGETQSITITMYDAYNNIATSYTGDKSLTFSGALASFYPNSPTIGSTAFGNATTVTFVSGIASNISMTLYDASHSTQDGLINVTNSRQTATGLELAVNVMPNSATNLRLDTQPSAYVRAGNALVVQPVVSIRDAFGNIVTTDDITTITASRNAGTASETLKGTVTRTAVDGVVTYTDLNYELMETITLDFVSNPALTTVTSNNIVVDHNATAQYAFTTVPSFIYAGGQRGAYVVTRYDAYDNLVNNVVNGDGTDATTAEPVYLYTSGIATNPYISSFNNSLTGGSTTTSVNIANNATTASFWYFSTNEGVHTITASDKTTAPPDGDTNIDDAVTTLEVKPAALSHFIVSGVGIFNQSTGYYESYYGDKQTITVEAIDIFGNRKINYTGTITFNVTDVESVRGVDYPADYTFTMGVGGDNGIHTFPASLILKPSYKHPDAPAVVEWWVSVVDMAQPSKYGSQTKIYVKKRPILVTAKPQSKIYGDIADLGQVEFTVVNNFATVDAPYLVANPNPAVYCNSEKVTAAAFTCNDGIPTTAIVGNYNILPTILTGINGFDIANYDVSYANGALTVNQRPITITATANQHKVYSTVDPSFTYSITSASPYNALVNGDTFAGALTRATGETVSSTYTINQTGLQIVNGATDKISNYDITFVSNDFSITPWPLVLSNISAADKTYDGNDDAMLTFSDNRPIVADAITFSKTADFSDKNVNWSNNVATAKTVSYSVAITGGAQAGNYIFSSAVPNASGSTLSWSGTTSATIIQRHINVTAQTDTKVYDGNTSSDKIPVVDALQIGDILTTTGTQTYDNETVGTGKALTASGTVIADGNSGNNYVISYVSSNLGTISTRSITISVTAGQTKVYGDANPGSYTYSVTSGSLANGDTFTGTISRASGESAGTYAVGKGTLTIVEGSTNKEVNYAVTFVGADFEITKRPITLLANDRSKIYGETLGLGTTEFALTSGTLAAGGTETVTSVTLTSAGAINTAPAGTYSVTASNATGSGGFLESNYDVTYSTGTLTVNKKELSIAANAGQSKIYGDSDPVLTYTPSGFVNSETIGIMSGRLSRESGIHVGAYPINLGTLTAGDNYSITYTASDFSITAKTVTVTATSGQSKTYGDLDLGVLGYSSNVSLGYNDVFVGTLSRTSGENVGTYAITQNSLSINDNQGNSVISDYTLNYVGDNFTINKLNVAVAAEAKSKTYGQSDPALTFTSTPAVGSELSNGSLISFTGTLTRDLGENVGTYTITQGSVANANYTLSYTPALLTINKLDITGNFTVDASKVYDGTTSSTVTSRTLNGVISPDDVSLFGGIARYDNKNVGTNKLVSLTEYTLTGTTAGNYNLTSVATTTATITTRDLTLTNFAANSKVYNGNKIATGIGFQDNRLGSDQLSFEWIAEFDSKNVGARTVNYKDIVIFEGADKDNYNLVTTTGVANANITARLLTLTATGVSKEYDNTDAAEVTFSDNRVTGDVFTVNYTARFNDKNVGDEKPINVTGISLSGTDALNYSIAATASTTANITAKTIMISPDAGQGKLVGAADPTFTFTSSPSLYSGDSFTGALGRNPGTITPNVGNYSYTLGTLSAGPNYTLVMTTSPATFAITRNTQSISLIAGWNIISSGVIPANPNADMLTVFNTLIQGSKLIKIMNESGKASEDWGPSIGWQNPIGNILSTEGYKVKVNSACTLNVSGSSVSLPLTIPLTTGWNIISYPASANQNAKSVVQALIDAGKLVKVMDEEGHAIEDWSAYGFGWQNNIGDFVPGKGYLVKVNANCTLTINEVLNKAATITPELIASSHFKTVFAGNGVDHMSINLTDLQKSGIRQGDEIGIFDGTVCVGASKIGADQMISGTISIPVSANDGLSETVNGFIVGNPVSIKLYRDGTESLLRTEILNNISAVFRKGESLFLKVSTDVATGIGELNQMLDVKFYPNPFTDVLSIEINSSVERPVDIIIYDTLGRKIRSLYKGSIEGSQILKWDGTSDGRTVVRPGIYYLRCNGLTFNGIIKR